MKEWKKPEVMTLGVESTEASVVGSGSDGWTWELNGPNGEHLEGELHS